MKAASSAKSLFKLASSFFVLFLFYIAFWFVQVKAEADKRYAEFSSLINCTAATNSCWESVDFNKFNTGEKILQAAREGFVAEFALPWPSPERIIIYTGIMIKFKEVQEVKVINRKYSNIT